MHQLFFLCILLFFYVQLVSNRNIDRPSKMILNFFVGFWSVALFLSIIRVGELNEVGDYTYLLIYIGTIAFVLGFLSVRISEKRGSIFEGEKLSSLIIGIANNKFFIILSAILCIYVYSLLVIFFDAVVMYQTLSNVRTDYFSGELYGPVFNQINAFVLTPFTIFSTPIFAYLIFYKRNLICFILGFFLIGYESLGGGRFGYIRILLALIFMIFILTNASRYYKKMFVGFSLSSILIVMVLLSITTMMRTTTMEDERTLQSVFETTTSHIGAYTAAPIAAFDYSLSNNYVKRIGGFQHGKLTLSAVTGMVNLFTSRLGFSFPLSLKRLTEIKQNEQIIVGKNSTSYNALYTANLFFYNDFGLFGVLIFPFVFGVLLRLLIKKMYVSNSYFMIAVVSWGFYVTFFSVIDFWLVDPYVLLSLIIFILLGASKKGLKVK